MSDGTGTGTYSYTWDAEGRLTKVMQGSTTISTYTYNALGQMVESNWVSPYNQLRDFPYDAFGHELGQFSYASSWDDQYVPLGGRNVAKYYYSTNTYFVHQNTLGSNMLVTDGSGTVQRDMGFYPWGQLWFSSGSNWDFHYAEFNQREFASNLDPTLFRMYSSNHGSWVTPDPAGLAAANPANPQSWNRYAYVFNSPTNLVDPLGLDDSGCIFYYDPSQGGYVLYCPSGGTGPGGAGGSGGPRPCSLLRVAFGGLHPEGTPCGGPSGGGGGSGGTGGGGGAGSGSSGPGSTNNNQNKQVNPPYCLDVFLGTAAQPFFSLLNYVQSAPNNLKGAAATAQNAGVTVTQIANSVQAIADAAAFETGEAPDMAAKLGTAAVLAHMASGYLTTAAQFAARSAPPVALVLVDFSLLYGVVNEGRAARNGQCH